MKLKKCTFKKEANISKSILPSESSCIVSMTLLLLFGFEFVLELSRAEIAPILLFNLFICVQRKIENQISKQTISHGTFRWIQIIFKASK